MTMYRVFVRNWWRWERDTNGGRKLVPDPGARKTTLARCLSEVEAQAVCRRYRDAHPDPGPVSRKAEYECE